VTSHKSPPHLGFHVLQLLSQFSRALFLRGVLRRQALHALFETRVGALQCGDLGVEVSRSRLQLVVRRRLGLSRRRRHMQTHTHTHMHGGPRDNWQMGESEGKHASREYSPKPSTLRRAPCVLPTGIHTDSLAVTCEQCAMLDRTNAHTLTHPQIGERARAFGLDRPQRGRRVSSGLLGAKTRVRRLPTRRLDVDLALPRGFARRDRLAFELRGLLLLLLALLECPMDAGGMQSMHSCGCGGNQNEKI
jgi:hypothetical protein